MGALGDLERFLERLFERPASRLFGAHLQPIHLQRRIERAMETERAVGADRTYAPNVFRLHLHPGDLEELAPVAESIASELADAALVFARAHRFVLADRPRVELIEDESVRAGDVRVVAEFAGAERPSPTDASLNGSVDSSRGADARSGGGQQTRASRPAIAGIRPDTMVFEVPAVQAPMASLRVTTPDGVQRTVHVEGAAMTIGRAEDCSLRLDDRRVSRHHARIQARRGALVLQDLGSTNGTRVNGLRIDEVALGEGDRIHVGDSVLVVERRVVERPGDEPPRVERPGVEPPRVERPGVERSGTS